MEYHYHVEDGQFSADYYLAELTGYEGAIIKLDVEDTGDYEEVYILYIDIDNCYIECIGNIERTFPKTLEDHDRLRDEYLARYHTNDEDNDNELNYNDGISEYDNR